VLTTSYTAAAFNNKNVGTSKSVQCYWDFDHRHGRRQLRRTPRHQQPLISPARVLSVTATGVNKVYDGSATASSDTER